MFVQETAFVHSVLLDTGNQMSTRENDTGNKVAAEDFI